MSEKQVFEGVLVNEGWGEWYLENPYNRKQYSSDYDWFKQGALEGKKVRVTIEVIEDSNGSSR